jgi:hypothetical protein
LRLVGAPRPGSDKSMGLRLSIGAASEKRKRLSSRQWRAKKPGLEIRSTEAIRDSREAVGHRRFGCWPGGDGMGRNTRNLSISPSPTLHTPCLAHGSFWCLGLPVSPLYVCADACRAFLSIDKQNIGGTESTTGRHRKEWDARRRRCGRLAMASASAAWRGACLIQIRGPSIQSPPILGRQ